MTDSPLRGRRIVVTRAPDQASQLADRLAELGAEPVLVPVLAIEPPADGGAALCRAAASVATGTGHYDWVILTSPNAADRWVAVHPAPWPAPPDGPKIAAVGPGTAARLPRVDLTPHRNLSEGLVEEFPPGPGRVLLPRAAVARDVIPDGLRAMGWTVDIVEAYRTVPHRPDPAVLRAARHADAIAFTSASTVTNYLAAAGRDALPATIVCIGPATADQARAEGLKVARVADPHTIAGLVAALVEHLAPDGGNGTSLRRR